MIDLGFERSYVTFVRQLRLLGLRPRCEACRTGGHGVTVELAHEPGEEIQWDWLELSETPWGEPAYVLVGALSSTDRHDGTATRRVRAGVRATTLTAAGRGEGSALGDDQIGLGSLSDAACLAAAQSSPGAASR